MSVIWNNIFTAGLINFWWKFIHLLYLASARTTIESKFLQSALLQLVIANANPFSPKLTSLILIILKTSRFPSTQTFQTLFNRLVEKHYTTFFTQLGRKNEVINITSMQTFYNNCLLPSSPLLGVIVKHKANHMLPSRCKAAV